MKSPLGKILLLIVTLVLAIFVGSVAGDLCVKVSALEWLGKTFSFGFEQFTLHLKIIDFTLGFMLNINLLQAILIVVALIVTDRLSK